MTSSNSAQAKTSSATPTLEEQIVAAVRNAIGPAEEMVLLHRPYLPPTAWTYIKECLDTGWVSSAGSYVTRFEEELAKFTGARRAVAVVNGTAALHGCLHLAGVKPGDEVLCPSLSFVATANAISHCGAIPHFVDASAANLGVCPEALEARLQEVGQPSGDGLINRQTGRRIAAVVLMHCFGHPGSIEEIKSICDRYSIPLIEDAAESLGSFYQGKHTGRYGTISAVSFNGNKILTTGGGGAILTDDNALADRAKHLTTTAKVPHAWEFHHDSVAWNYRLPNLNAALGVAQLEILPELIAAKRRLAERYQAAFQKVPGLRFLEEPPATCSNYWLNGICLEADDLDQRNAVLQALNQANYQSRPLWQPMHFLPMYAACPRGDLQNTESLYRRIINIPSSPDLALNR
jgi:perosamine synthetase